MEAGGGGGKQGRNVEGFRKRAIGYDCPAF
jgi:hypothetical protein